MSFQDASFSLTEKENNLFDVLLNSIQAKNRKTVARIAGGWVRDKLLHRFSDDIDVALDDQSGVEFANNLNDYLQSLGQQTGSVAVIQANPEQSKHLETATVHVLDHFIDCVNLRSESYANNSRIPEIRFGSPYEDAMRRDFTINSLFFNLNTREIEDFTSRGLEDLRLGVIRTPLPPMETFADDPLRVLRAVRFASRLNFQLADDLIVAARNPIIQEALGAKVSRERILKELFGMMNRSGHPYVGWNMIHWLGLLDNIFLINAFKDKVSHVEEYRSMSLPIQTLFDITADPSIDITRWKSKSTEAIRWLSTLLVLRQNNSSDYFSHGTAVRRRQSESVEIRNEELMELRGSSSMLVCYYAALCSGFSQYSILEKKTKPSPAVSVILRESLKMDSDTMKQVQTILDNVAFFHRYAVAHVEPETDQAHLLTNRVEAGLLIRDCKELWEDVLLVACAIELTAQSISMEAKYCTSSYDELCSSTSLSLEEVKRRLTIENVRIEAWAQEIIHRYNYLHYKYKFEYNLGNAYEIKPIFDGSQLMKVLPTIKRGPIVGKVMEEQIKWQIRYPEGSPDSLRSHLENVLPTIS